MYVLCPSVSLLMYVLCPSVSFSLWPDYGLHSWVLVKRWSTRSLRRWKGFTSLLTSAVGRRSPILSVSRDENRHFSVQGISPLPDSVPEESRHIDHRFRVRGFPPTDPSSGRDGECRPTGPHSESRGASRSQGVHIYLQIIDGVSRQQLLFDYEDFGTLVTRHILFTSICSVINK